MGDFIAIKEIVVGAREKLNSFHILGAIGAAGLIGLATGSWTVAVIAGTVIVGLSLHKGEIRLKGRH